MNRNALKIIAAVTMAIDHIGVIMLQPDTLEYYVLRSIGRIAFILFAYMIAEGFFKTSNLKNYFLRLLIFASIIEAFIIGFYVVTGENYILTYNVIWPLVFGLGALLLLKNKSVWIRFSSVLVVFVAELLKIPYGAYGVIIIMIFGLYRNPLTQFLFVLGVNLIFIDFPLLTYLDLDTYAKYIWVQWFSMFAFVFIFLYNGKNGKHRMKWFFYIFYPVHLGIIYLINYMIVKG